MAQIHAMVKAVADLRAQAFEYACFLNRFAAANGASTEREPPPITIEAIRFIEASALDALAADNQTFSTLAEYRREQGETSPEPGLFGPSAASLSWTYRTLHQWLDQLYWRLSLLMTKADMENASQPTYNVSISQSTGPININSHLDGAIQTVNSSTRMPQADRAELVKTLAELRAALGDSPAAQLPDAEIIAEQADAVVSEAARDEARPGFLKIKASGLLEAAKAIQTVLPTAYGIARRLAELVTSSIS
jgi:hypothetical protein